MVVLAVAFSVLAFGAVHPWAYEALWLVCALAFALAVGRAVLVAGARERFGTSPIAFHSSGRWLVLDPDKGDTALGWGCDLGAPALPRGPLLWPGLAMAAIVLLQLVPWPPARSAWTLDPDATRRGLSFLLAFLALHLAAGAAFTGPAARRRFRRTLAWLGLLVGLVALVQLASGVRLIYGFFQPWESTRFYGPFVNRNHFAGWMLMAVPVALGVMGDAWRRYDRRVGDRPNVRRRLVGLGTHEGTRLLYAAIPPLVGIAALLASTSRGGILAFAAGLALAAIGLRSARGTPVWAAALVFVALVVFWFGLERLQVRFLQAPEDAPGRTVVWKESLALMQGPRWIAGTGLDTFSDALSRVPAWRLPQGATPWPPAVRDVLESGAPVGYRAPRDLPGLAWYREAHNDWVQLLVEMGVPGLAIGLWGALAALVAARRDPWLFAALAGPLMHAFVDFDFQIPAIPTLFVVLAALAGRSAAAARE